MSMPIWVVRRGSILRPYAEADDEAIRALPEEFEIVPKLKRSNRQLRLYWQLMTVIAENLDQPVSSSTLSNWFKLRCGLTDEIKMKSGDIMTLPSSIAFDKMPQDQFNAYFDKVKDLARKAGMYTPALEKHVQELIG